jgi:hypothetical protein
MYFPPLFYQLTYSVDMNSGKESVLMALLENPNDRLGWVCAQHLGVTGSIHKIEDRDQHYLATVSELRQDY